MPVSQVALSGDNVVLLDLTKQQLDNMPEYKSDNNTNNNQLAADQNVDIGSTH